MSQKLIVLTAGFLSVGVAWGAELLRECSFDGQEKNMQSVSKEALAVIKHLGGVEALRANIAAQPENEMRLLTTAILEVMGIEVDPTPLLDEIKKFIAE